MEKLTGHTTICHPVALFTLLAMRTMAIMRGPHTRIRIIRQAILTTMRFLSYAIQERGYGLATWQNIKLRLIGVSRLFRTLRLQLQTMKRHNHLFELVTSYSNLWAAYINARKGKTHYREVKLMDKNPEHYVSNLQKLLLTETFKNSEYEVFTRVTGGKERQIYKLPFYPDRVLHHAIVQIMMPIWMNLLIRDTYATIPKRGIHDGVKRVKSALKDTRNTQYCLKLDIKKYYPSINHDILKSILRRKVKDEWMMRLLEEIIDSADGIPIGNYVSQWLGNIYLAYFDHFVKEDLGVKYYFRYADDLVLLHSNKQHLRSLKIDIEHYLNQYLDLRIKENWQIFPVNIQGIDFLGYRFYHNYTLVRKSIVKRFKKKIKNHKASKQTESAYWGWFKHANTFNLQTKYFTS